MTTNAAAPGTNFNTIRVMDNGTPPLSDNKTLPVFISTLPQFTGLVAVTSGQIQITFATLLGQHYQI